MASLRAWHNYLSVLVAPTILFFALTGIIQVFDLHESHGPYTAPLILQELGRLHKDQVFAPPEQHDRGPASPASGNAKPGAAAPPDDDDGGGKNMLPIYALKWVCTLAALALIVSTCLGVWIAVTSIRRRPTSYVLLAVGTIVPLTLVLI